MFLSNEQKREADQLRDATKKDCAREFENWLDAPMNRFGLSLIPAGEHPEALQTLLRACFEAGFNSGAGHMTKYFAERIFKMPSGPEGR